MVEINPVTGTYPIKKINKVIPEKEHSDNNSTPDKQRENQDEKSQDPSGYHIDEIV